MTDYFEFTDMAAFTTWHDARKLQVRIPEQYSRIFENGTIAAGTTTVTDYVRPITHANGADNRVIARIQPNDDQTGMTVKTEAQVISDGYFDGGVTDTTPPVITLVGANPQTLEAGTSYVELGATATDDVDGNITEDIVIDISNVNMNAVGSYTVNYDVQDAAGNNATQVTRTVNVQDTTPPVITLTGDNPQFITTNDPYVELGATATDNLDGDISGSIVIDASAVNTAVDGDYTVTYNVTDANGNVANQVARTVTVATITINVAPPAYSIASERPAETNVLLVGSGETHTNLDSAIAAVSANNTIIKVKNGTYGKPGDINIPFSVWIEPFDSDTPSFVWSSPMNDHVRLESANITFSGKDQMSFRNTQSSDIFRILGDDITIHGCSFSMSDSIVNDPGNLSACILARGSRARLINNDFRNIPGDAIYFGSDHVTNTIEDVWAYGNNMENIGAAGIQFNPHELGPSGGEYNAQYTGTHIVEQNRLVYIGFNNINVKQGIVVTARWPDNQLATKVIVRNNWVENVPGSAGIKMDRNGHCLVEFTSNYVTDTLYGIWVKNPEDSSWHLTTLRDNHSWNNDTFDYNIHAQAIVDSDSSNVTTQPNWLP